MSNVIYPIEDLPTPQPGDIWRSTFTHSFNSVSGTYLLHENIEGTDTYMATFLNDGTIHTITIRNWQSALGGTRWQKLA